MFKDRQRRRDARAPEYITYAVYLHRTPGALRMYLRGLSLPNLEAFAEGAVDLPRAHAQALRAELLYRRGRPQMAAGAKDE